MADALWLDGENMVIHAIDDEGQVEIRTHPLGPYSQPAFINEDDAKKIIQHLTDVFELEQE